jgi:Family of unknown function (DUF6064)
MFGSTAGEAGHAFDRWLEWLGDLATYRPSDFLMFAPRTYWRLFELHNEAWWPLPLAMPLLGLVGLVMLAWRGRSGRGAMAWRWAAGSLAAAAAFVGGAFVIERYAAVNWAAQGLAWMWAALALLLATLAASGQVRPASDPLVRRVAVALGLAALLVHPLLARMAGRPFMQAEVFGLAPDPTVIVVLAWLLACSVAAATGPICWAWRAAWALSLALCASSAATLALLDEWQAGVPLLAAGVATGAMARVVARRVRRGSGAA